MQNANCKLQNRSDSEGPPFGGCKMQNANSKLKIATFFIKIKFKIQGNVSKKNCKESVELCKTGNIKKRHCISAWFCSYFYQMDATKAKWQSYCSLPIVIAKRLKDSIKRQAGNPPVFKNLFYSDTQIVNSPPPAL